MTETPLLDCEEAPPKAPSTWRARAVGGLIGAAISVTYIMQDQGALPHWSGPGINWLLVWPALYAAIAVHEAGHALAGALTGFAFGGISVGPLLFHKSGTNWVFRWDWRAPLGGFFKPLTAAAGASTSSFAWMIAGGPLASVALAVGWFFAWMQGGNGMWQWIGAVFWASLFIGVLVLIPFSTGAAKSDAALLRQLWGPREGAERWMALVALMTEEANGVRPADWDAGLFAKILAIPASEEAYAYCQLLAYYRVSGEDSDPAGLTHLENALRGSARQGIAMRHALFLEASSANGLARGNAEKARVWLDRAVKLRKPKSLYAVEAAIAMCEGKDGEAVTLWAKARADLAERKLDSGMARYARECWEKRERECLRRLAGSQAGL